MNLSGDSVRNLGAQAWETSDPDGNTYNDNKTANTTGLPVDEAARKNGEAAQSVSNTTASAVVFIRTRDPVPSSLRLFASRREQSVGA